VISLPLRALLLLSLAACGPEPAPAPVPTVDPRAFLTTTVCGDGSFSVLDPTCPGRVALTGKSLLTWRRYDWAYADQAQVQDTFFRDDGWVATFSYPPHLELNPANGDGGDFFELKGDQVFISYTQNGDGHGGTVAGWWVGINCGGTSWTSFDRYATATWRSEVARLKGSAVRDACPSLDSAYTRWRVLPQLPVHLIVQQLDGTIEERTVPLDAIVSEHYDAFSVDLASAMERQVHVAGLGPSVFWETWVKSPPSPPPTFACEGAPGANGSPGTGWTLWDRRCRTVMRPFLPVRTGDQYGWPPANAAQ